MEGGGAMVSVATSMDLGLHSAAEIMQGAGQIGMLLAGTLI